MPIVCPLRLVFIDCLWQMQLSHVFSVIHSTDGIYGWGERLMDRLLADDIERTDALTDGSVYSKKGYSINH